MAFSLTSTAFTDGAAIPVKHTCDGADVSPPLAWSGAPAGTRAFALIADDPDAPAGTWVHWVLYDLPAAASELPENVAKVETLDLGGARQGRNDFRRPGYGGPCPPPGPAVGRARRSPGGGNRFVPGAPHPDRASRPWRHSRGARRRRPADHTAPSAPTCRPERPGHRRSGRTPASPPARRSRRAAVTRRLRRRCA